MPRKEGKKMLTLAISEADLATLHEVARKRGFPITSDYIRNLIEKDTAEHGENLKFEVDRGGYRKDKEE